MDSANRCDTAHNRSRMDRGADGMELDTMTTAIEIMDFYIEHYTKLGHVDTVRKLKEIRIDMKNAERFKEDG